MAILYRETIGEMKGKRVTEVGGEETITGSAGSVTIITGLSTITIISGLVCRNSVSGSAEAAVPYAEKNSPNAGMLKIINKAGAGKSRTFDFIVRGYIGA